MGYRIATNENFMEQHDTMGVLWIQWDIVLVLQIWEELYKNHNI